MTQSDLEWPMTAKEIAWMTQYDFRWLKSTCASPFWGPSYLDISVCSDSVTSGRETTTLCILVQFENDMILLQIFVILVGCQWLFVKKNVWLC